MYLVATETHRFFGNEFFYDYAIDKAESLINALAIAIENAQRFTSDVVLIIDVTDGVGKAILQVVVPDDDLATDDVLQKRIRGA